MDENLSVLFWVVKQTVASGFFFHPVLKVVGESHISSYLCPSNHTRAPDKDRKRKRERERNKERKRKRKKERKRKRKKKRKEREKENGPSRSTSFRG